MYAEDITLQAAVKSDSRLPRYREGYECKASGSVVSAAGVSL